MRKAKELKDQSVDELKVLCNELSKQIFELKNELKTTHKIEKPHLIREKRRERARVLTILRQKDLALVI